MGMTDMQFKAYTKQLLRRIERIRKMLDTTDAADIKEQLKKELDELLDDLQQSIEG